MKLFTTVVAMIFAFLSGQVFSADSVMVQNQTAVAKDVNLFVGHSAPKKTFRFSNGEAWLDENGSFQLKLEVKHRKLLCARYRTSINFAVGNPGCQQVVWDDETAIKLASKRQCNNAELVHIGGDTVELLAQQYKGLSCARVQVSCSGKFCR